MDWTIVAHAWTHIADARHGNAKCLIIVKTRMHLIGIHTTQRQNESTQEEGTDKEGNKPQKSLHHIGGDNVSVHPDRRDGTRMENVGELILQHPVDDAANMTNSRTGISWTGHKV